MKHRDRLDFEVREFDGCPSTDAEESGSSTVLTERKVGQVHRYPAKKVRLTYCKFLRSSTKPDAEVSSVSGSKLIIPPELIILTHIARV